MPERPHLIVIGGGAAGFFCAVNAARLNPLLKVTILERSNKLLSKVRISGGGRCNVTHACYDIAEMAKHYPRGGNFVKKSFHQFFVPDTIKWFEDKGVKLKTEPDGRMFPVSNSSQSIIDCLLREANKHEVEIRMHSEVKSLAWENGVFHLELSDLRTIRCNFVCVACGGYPKPPMFDWLRQTGHGVEEPVPSLFSFNLPSHPVTRLMGISVPQVRIKLSNTKLVSEGPMLITHWGFSGPAVLKLSAWGARVLKELNWHFSITVNWMPSYNEQSLYAKFQELRMESGQQKMKNKSALLLPHRLWEYFLAGCSVDGEARWADLTAKQQSALARTICLSSFEVKGKTSYKEEFVTAGGVRLSEIDANTMMSRKIPGLFFAGEVMDVDGLTGGFNFQHAWTSGFIAGKTIAGLSVRGQAAA